MDNFYESCTLPNGIRVVHKQVPHTQIAHCGFILDIGSRDEKPHQLGIAHFWEHMAFKGTKKRKAYHIINRLESVGGEMNAHTSKEKISFYASFLRQHYEKAMELLSDITFDSIFPENQIERERQVILEEMAMYADAPDDALTDIFDAIVFANHPLGNNILGTTESIAKFEREDFRNFFQENINTHQIVFSSVGNLTFKQVLKLAEKYIMQVPELQGQKQRTTFTNYTPQILQKYHRVSQAYCAIGRPAYSYQHPKRLAFAMLTNILGGRSLNSRLNMALRERHGYVYSVEANYGTFSDTGLFAIYFATEPKQLQRSMSLVMKEIKNLREQKLGALQLHQAKEQILGQSAMDEESNLNFMQIMGGSILDLGRVEAFEEIAQQIRKITAEDILDVANEILQEDSLSTLTYLGE
jgi:predicted Zn-dependent peptidase